MHLLGPAKAKVSSNLKEVVPRQPDTCKSRHRNVFQSNARYVWILAKLDGMRLTVGSQHFKRAILAKVMTTRLKETEII